MCNIIFFIIHFVIYDSGIVATYSNGSGSYNCNLTLGYGNTFKEKCYGCFGENIKNGHFVVFDNFIYLIEAKYIFLITKWGRRIYLLDPKNIVGFCNSINHMSEPREIRIGANYLRNGDEKLPLIKGDKVPLEVRWCIFWPGTTFKIKEIAGNGDIIVDSGIDKGLTPGLALIAKEANEIDAIDTTLIVNSSSENEAVLKLMFGFSSYKYKPGDLITPTRRQY